MEKDKFQSYANSFQAIARLELESIRRMLDHLGHPEEKLEFIHVAGTNGKGSVCAFLQKILTDAGYRTGKYISPNMVSVTERISVDGQDISEAELSELLASVEDAAKQTEAELGGPPTQFEIWTAAAFCYFYKQDCDIVILETGLGGSRDATNVIQAAKVNVITRIAMDHMEYLGETLGKIAGEKAGILKEQKDGVCVTLQQEPEAMQVLESACKEKKHRLIVTKQPEIHEPKDGHECFSYRGMEQLLLGIAGPHQVENALLAIETAKVLQIAEKHICKGLLQARNIGRFELVKERVLFDGAHNPNGMQALMQGLKRYYPQENVNFVMGCMGDKDISGSLMLMKKAYPDAEFFAVCVKDNPRAMEAERLFTLARENGFSASACKGIHQAVEEAGRSGRLVVICGSLYLYKDWVESEK